MPKTIVGVAGAKRPFRKIRERTLTRSDAGPRLARAIVVGLAVGLVAMAALSAAPARAQSGFDRPGGDYTNASVPSGDPAVCAARCEREARCRAWTYRRQGYGVSAPHCYLKDAVKPPRRRPCCISGVVR